MVSFREFPKNREIRTVAEESTGAKRFKDFAAQSWHRHCPTASGERAERYGKGELMGQPQVTSALGAPLLVGVLTIVCTVPLHGTAGYGVVHLAQRAVRSGFAGGRFGRNVIVLSVAMLVALAAHLIQIAAWALVFELCGEFSGFPAAFYHSAVNYTTLGYGDFVMSPPWRLLGPIEAADGMLMFAFSTAIVVTIIQRIVRASFDRIGPTSIE
jgi:hypothetical protein